MESVESEVEFEQGQVGYLKTASVASFTIRSLASKKVFISGSVAVAFSLQCSASLLTLSSRF